MSHLAIAADVLYHITEASNSFWKQEILKCKTGAFKWLKVLTHNWKPEYPWVEEQPKCAYRHPEDPIDTYNQK